MLANPVYCTTLSYHIFVGSRLCERLIHKNYSFLIQIKDRTTINIMWQTLDLKNQYSTLLNWELDTGCKLYSRLPLSETVSFRSGSFATRVTGERREARLDVRILVKKRRCDDELAKHFERRSKDLEMELKRDMPMELVVANGDEVGVAMDDGEREASLRESERNGVRWEEMKYLWGFMMDWWNACWFLRKKVASIKREVFPLDLEMC